MTDVTDRDRERAKRLIWGPHGSSTGMEDRIAAALAEEREKARARIASDLVDLVNDSGGDVWVRALLDFAAGLESE